jgi:hypothetical protein
MSGPKGQIGQKGHQKKDRLDDFDFDPKVQNCPKDREPK